MKRKIITLLIGLQIGYIHTEAQYDGRCEDTQGEALLNGANDVIVVRSANGQLRSTGWHAQIGKMSSLLTSREGKLVSIFVNSVPARTRMKVCDSGLAQFLPGTGATRHRMSQDDLQELNLKPGHNEGKYVVSDLKIIINFSVFLYDVTDKFILTDVDGTITESDIKGQVLPHLGISAQHKQVVKLFDRIEKNGYKVVYLTARSMAQDEDTRSYLFTMLQDVDGSSLPLGPVLMSPTTFMSGLISEVVTGTPDVQKTKTVNDIWSLFQIDPSNTKIGDTIVAGYGNKETDTRAYTNAGIPLNTIYIVNPEGQLKNEGTGNMSSYTEQAEHVNSLYPELL